MRAIAEVLGPVRIVVEGATVDLGGPRQRRLLAALLVRSGSVVSTDQLIEATFDGHPPANALSTFRTYVARLRRALDVAGLDGASIVLTEAPGYRIPDDVIEFDAALFEQALEAAQDQLLVGEADGALISLDEALALWSGTACGEFGDEEWFRSEARRLNELHLVAREVHAEAVVESGRPAVAIPEVEALIDEHPFREAPRRVFILALYRAGRHSEALRAGREYRRFLRDETGLDPSEQVMELERLVLDRDPRLDARPPGRKIRGYILGAPIEESALGVTYQANQPSIDRNVAITVINADQVDSESFIRRFELHARRIATIDHPGVVPLYDYWREPGGAYLVTRLVDGASLKEHVAHHVLTPDDVIVIVDAVGAALTAAHERGVAHGRLTRSCVHLDARGVAVVGGFGLDVDYRAAPADIEALASLSRSLWEQTDFAKGSDPGIGPISHAVQLLVERASGEALAPTFGTATDFATAFENAVRKSSSDDAPGSSEIRIIEGPNPYRGLATFDEVDADVFFGRGALVDELFSNLKTHPFVAVVGPSGSGKSSIVRAGLLPRLRSEGALIATMIPGPRPLAELGMALSRIASAPVPDLDSVLSEDEYALPEVLDGLFSEANPPIVLLIDQLEEAFTLAQTKERDVLLAAIAQLLRERDHFRVVVTARADFLGPILNDRSIGAWVRDNSVLVAPLNSEQVHAAIVGPAEVAGIAVESALASRLVADAAVAAGQLPLLQYALTELYEHRVDGAMTIEVYNRLGGLTSILAQRAEELYSALDPAERDASRRLFSRLITPGNGTDDTRRRARQTELVGIPSDLLDIYGTARLISFDRDAATREPTVEVAHEALIREWPRLRDWIDEDRTGVRAQHHLTTSASDWDASDRDPGELYRGIRLAVADEWATSNPASPSDEERAFLDASRNARDRELEAQHRQLRIRTSGLIVITIVAVLAVIGGLVALGQSRAADRNASEADLRRVMAESRAAVDDDPSRALLLALEAYRLSPSNETLGAIQQAVVGTPTAWLGDVVTGHSYRRVDFRADGSLFAATNSGVELWNLTDRALVHDYAFASVADIELSADGRTLAVGSSSGRWVVLDGHDLTEIGSGEASTGIAVIRVGPNDHIALGLDDGTTELVSLTSLDRGGVTLPGLDRNGEPIGTPVTDLSFDADGRRLAVAWGAGNPAQSWDISDPFEIGAPRISEGSAKLVLYEDDVLYIALSNLQALDANSLKPIGDPIDLGQIIGPNMQLTSGDQVLHLAGAGAVIEFDLREGSTRTQQFLQDSTTAGADISADGRVIAFATADGFSLWALDGAGLFVDSVVPALADFTEYNAITGDGLLVVQGGNIGDGTPSRITDFSLGEPDNVFDLPPGVGLRVTHNEVIKYVESPNEDRDLDVAFWDRRSSSFTPLTDIDFMTFGVHIPLFTPDGRTFIHPWNNEQGIVDVYNVETGQLLHRLRDLEDAAPPNTSFSSVPVLTTDGNMLVYPTSSEYVAVYNLDSWELHDLLEPSVGFSEVVFTPDGSRAITHSVRGLEIRDAEDLRSILLGPVPAETSPALGLMLEITEDGRYLKTASPSGARLWDPATLEPIGGRFPHDALAWAPALSPERNQLAAVYQGETILWNIDLEAWPELACIATGRNLTSEEWTTVGPQGEYHTTCDRWPPS